VPLHPERLPASPASGSAIAWSNPGLDTPPSILLVDDDEVTRLLTALALRERGFRVDECASGHEALERLHGHAPDVVVLDAMMPPPDGFETCRQIRQRPYLSMLPVLMLTGLDDEASIQRAFEVGATDFFVKSTQWSLLAGRLHYLLRSARTSLELARNRARLARAQDLARMGSFDGQLNPPAIHLSEEARRVLGQDSRDTLSLRRLMRQVDPSDRTVVFGMMRHLRQQGITLDHDITFRLADQRQRVIHVEAEPEFDEHGLLCGYSGIVQDVTERRLIEDRVRHLANFDALTGLPNRRQLMIRIEKALELAWRLGHELALLLIDLDRFKVINDTLGHAAGDELLLEIGRRLRACVRQNDQIVESSFDAQLPRSHRGLEAIGRLGGDEFVALLPEIHSFEDAERVAQRILDVLSRPVMLGGREYFVTASLGVAIYPRDADDVMTLLRHADIAMYQAKSIGRNTFSFYHPDFNRSGSNRLELESDLHKALERQELVLVYQPKVDVANGRVVGAEALMRWYRNGVLIPPSEFIPLAEETGLIVPLSDWALREVARQISAWHAESGLEVSVAVNLPVRLFERSDLVERLIHAITPFNIPARLIQLEITETSLMRNLHEVIPALQRLSHLGVQVAIDDFGTGYSSLAYLTSLPISEVKIDRSFVNDLGTSEQSKAVVTAIVALARALHLRVIAEGVETERQLEVLHQLGCDLVQGYLYARPLSAEAFLHWLRQPVHPRPASGPPVA
jgi:predicted signal transduction protein with EAL and GGDEF domain/DNA-binding response OmpR family regulator